MAGSTAGVPHTPWARALATAVGLAAVVSLVVLAFSWPSVTSEVKNLPVALVGNAAQISQVESALDKKSPGTFDFTEVGSRQDAVSLIKERKAYGALVLDTAPEMLTASAASPIVSQLLTGVAGQLEVQLNQAAAAQGVKLPQPITVSVTDVVPLASSDARGTGLTIAAFPLVLGGMLGGILISMLVIGAWRKIGAGVLYSAVGGLALAGMLQGWFGILQGNYLLNAAAVGLTLLAMAATIFGFSALVGRAGVAIGPVLFILIANPISSAAQPLELLPQPWGLVGQWFPPGAGATLLRDLSYFPDANTSFPWLVLAGWSLAGLVLAVAGHFRTSVAEVPAEELDPIAS